MPKIKLKTLAPKDDKPEIAALAAEYKTTLSSTFYDPTMLQLCMLIGNQHGAAYRTSVRSGVSASCIGAWMAGKTHRPVLRLLQGVFHLAVFFADSLLRCRSASTSCQSFCHS